MTDLAGSSVTAGPRLNVFAAAAKAAPSAAVVSRHEVGLKAKNKEPQSCAAGHWATEDTLAPTVAGPADNGLSGASRLCYAPLWAVRGAEGAGSTGAAASQGLLQGERAECERTTRAEPCPTYFFGGLPVELFEQVAGQLDVATLLTLRATSKPIHMYLLAQWRRENPGPNSFCARLASRIVSSVLLTPRNLKRRKGKDQQKLHLNRLQERLLNNLAEPNDLRQLLGERCLDLRVAPLLPLQQVNVLRALANILVLLPNVERLEIGFRHQDSHGPWWHQARLTKVQGRLQHSLPKLNFIASPSFDDQALHLFGGPRFLSQQTSFSIDMSSSVAYLPAFPGWSSPHEGIFIGFARHYRGRSALISFSDLARFFFSAQNVLDNLPRLRRGFVALFVASTLGVHASNHFERVEFVLPARLPLLSCEGSSPQSEHTWRCFIQQVEKDLERLRIDLDSLPRWATAWREVLASTQGPLTVCTINDWQRPSMLAPTWPPTDQGSLRFIHLRDEALRRQAGLAPEGSTAAAVARPAKYSFWAI